MSKYSKRQVARQISSMAAKPTEFNPDYSIIKRDLRRIGVLAGAFIVILVVLSFFQNQLLGIFLK
jgi:hypothetical protein